MVNFRWYFWHSAPISHCISSRAKIPFVIPARPKKQPLNERKKSKIRWYSVAGKFKSTKTVVRWDLPTRCMMTSALSASAALAIGTAFCGFQRVTTPIPAPTEEFTLTRFSIVSLLSGCLSPLLDSRCGNQNFHRDSRRVHCA